MKNVLNVIFNVVAALFIAIALTLSVFSAIGVTAPQWLYWIVVVLEVSVLALGGYVYVKTKKTKE